MASKDNLLDGGVDNLQFFDAPKPQASKAPIQNTNNDLDDIFGGGGPTQNSSNNMQTNIGFGQPQANIGFGQSQANMYGGSPAQAQTKSMFASDATDIFNTAPVNMMNQNYYGGTQGYGTYNQGYGMYNQNYGAEAQNYGMEGQGYGMQYSGMYNTGMDSNVGYGGGSQFRPDQNQFNTGYIMATNQYYNQEYNTGYYNQGYGGQGYSQQNYQQPSNGGANAYDYQTSNYSQPTQDFDLFGKSNAQNKQSAGSSNLDDLFG